MSLIIFWKTIWYPKNEEGVGVAEAAKTHWTHLWTFCSGKVVETNLWHISDLSEPHISVRRGKRRTSSQWPGLQPSVAAGWRSVTKSCRETWLTDESIWKQNITKAANLGHWSLTRLCTGCGCGRTEQDDVWSLRPHTAVFTSWSVLLQTPLNFQGCLPFFGGFFSDCSLWHKAWGGSGYRGEWVP